MFPRWSALILACGFFLILSIVYCRVEQLQILNANQFVVMPYVPLEVESKRACGFIHAISYLGL